MDKKLRLIFEKRGLVSFISHRDLMQLFERIFRIAEIPIRYSKGFNPHPSFSIASPLPVGVEGKGELMDVELIEKISPNKAKEDLNKVLPKGIRIKAAYLVDKSNKDINYLNIATYIIKTKKAIDKIDLNRWVEENPVFTKTTKSGRQKTCTLKDSLIDVKLYFRKYIVVKLNTQGGTSFSTILESLCSYTKIEVTDIKTIRRIELFNGTFRGF